MSKRWIDLIVIIALLILVGYYANRPTQIISYQLDSWGGQVIGTVDDKYQIGESYNLVIDDDYFAVNKEQYHAVHVGDRIIGFLSKGE